MFSSFNSSITSKISSECPFSSNSYKKALFNKLLSLFSVEVHSVECLVRIKTTAEKSLDFS